MNDKLRKKLERQARQQENLMTYYKTPGYKSVRFNKANTRNTGAILTSKSL